MLVHLVATLAVALVACLLAWALGRRFRRPLPGYALPMVAAGVAIGYGVYAEYSWAGRTEAALPGSFAVLQRVDERSAFAPWSWLVPRVVRLSAIDTAAVRRHPSHPELRLLDIVLLGRFQPTRRVAQLVDCDGERRADLATGATFGADGLPAEIRWRERAVDDPVVLGACAA